MDLNKLKLRQCGLKHLTKDTIKQLKGLTSVAEGSLPESTMNMMLDDVKWFSKYYDCDVYWLENNSKIVGWAYIRDRRPLFKNEVGVFVAPEYRNKKLGSRLIEHILQAHQVEILAKPWDRVGLNFYHKLEMKHPCQIEIKYDSEY